jgi:hypothetical protein
VKFAAIADWVQEKQYPVTFMCDQLGVVRQGYYRWCAEGPCERERTDAELTDTILAIHTELDGNPGVRRVWAELAARGMRVGPKRVWRLMQAAGLRGRHPRAWKKTTIAGAACRCARPDRAGFHRRATQHAVVRRHHLFGSAHGYVQFCWRRAFGMVIACHWTAHNHRSCRKARRRSPG